MLIKSKTSISYTSSCDCHVTPWLTGGCLDQLLHDFGYFGENVICNYAKQITHGIVFLHENGIIHRDLKGRIL